MEIESSSVRMEDASSAFRGGGTPEPSVGVLSSGSSLGETPKQCGDLALAKTHSQCLKISSRLKSTFLLKGF